MNDGFQGLASDVVVLRVKYPDADRGRLISQGVEAIGGNDDFPDGLFGLFAKSVAALMQRCFYGSNICGNSLCLCRFGFFHWYSISGYYSDCPASGLRSRQLLFLFRSNNNQTGESVNIQQLCSRLDARYMV